MLLPIAGYLNRGQDWMVQVQLQKLIAEKKLRLAKGMQCPILGPSESPEELHQLASQADWQLYSYARVPYSEYCVDPDVYQTLDPLDIFRFAASARNYWKGVILFHSPSVTEGVTSIPALHCGKTVLVQPVSTKPRWRDEYEVIVGI